MRSLWWAGFQSPSAWRAISAGSRPSDLGSVGQESFEVGTVERVQATRSTVPKQFGSCPQSSETPSSGLILQCSGESGVYGKSKTVVNGDGQRCYSPSSRLASGHLATLDAFAGILHGLLAAMAPTVAANSASSP